MKKTRIYSPRLKSPGTPNICCGKIISERYPRIVGHTYGNVELSEPLEEVISYGDSVSRDRALIFDIESLKLMTKTFDL